MNSITNRGVVAGILFAVSIVALLPFAFANADAFDIVDTYYPEGNPGSFDIVDTYYNNDDIVDTYYNNNDYDIVDSYSNNDYDTVDSYYSNDCGCYTSSNSTPSYSWSGGGSSYGGSRSIGWSFPSSPMTFHAPTYYPPTYHAPSTPSVTNNTCVNNSCNNTFVDNSVTQIDNSINNSVLNSGTIQNSALATGVSNVATVYPITATPVQYQVQYVQPTYYAQPSCVITLNRYVGSNYGQYGTQLSTLSWTSANASYGYINPGVGSVSGYGSMSVYTVNGQVYTMTVYGQGGTSATCSTIAYSAPIVTNPTPYVSLSQIPYTGFDFGTIGNSIYWISLMIFAGAVAYLALYFQGGVLALFSQKSGARAQVVIPKIAVAHAPAPVLAVAKPVLSPIQIVAPVRTNTSDKMNIHMSKAGEAPRISISRE